MRNRAVFFSCFFFCTLLALEAAASKIYYRDVTLEDVVKSAEVVVIAVPADPDRRIEHVDITPPGKKKDAEKYPAFARVIQRWTVKEVLKDPAGAKGVTPGLVIEVESGKTDQRLHMHRLYYVQGVSKSPIYEQFKPTGESTAPERILFLDRAAKHFLLARGDAIENVENRAAVEALLKPAPAPAPAPPAPPAPKPE